ncbi:MAG: sugar phosphate nucleotidyltransferase [Firmicutes bacterium]|nr:sugar phosphate nucleotidyltransferase [Bacillota bacterium]
MQVTKAIITCGGYSTRFLPITKSVPKEMLPIHNKPIIHYIVEELQQAGITDILILCGRGREVTQNYFDKNFEVDTVLERKGVNIELNPFRDLNIMFKRVAMPRGSADCIYHAKQWVGNEPFVVAYSDDLFLGGNPTQELLDAYKKFKKPLLTTTQVPDGEQHKYGIIRLDKRQYIDEIIEKPMQNPPSNLAVVGRYLLTKDFFKFFEEDRKTLASDKEVCTTAQLNKFTKTTGLRYVTTEAKRFDTGQPVGWLDANLWVLTNFVN